MDKEQIINNKEQEFKTFIDSMTEEQKASLVGALRQGVSDLISKFEVELVENEEAIVRKKQEELSLWETERTLDYSAQVLKAESNNKRTIIRIQIKAHENKIRSLKNLILCLQNNGMIVQLEDQLGFVHTQIADFRQVNTDSILFNEDTILVDEKPVYIPTIDEENFRQKGYVFDAIRYDKNSYLLSTSKYEQSKDFEGYSHFVIVTLDQLVLISEYYYMVAKANANKKAEEQTKRVEEYYDKLSYEKRNSFLNQKGYYRAGLPVAVQKKISQADYEALSLEEKEKLYKPFKKYGAERLKTKLGDNEMWVSFHEMYQRFVNKDAHPVNKFGELQVGKRAGMGLYGNPEIFKYWYAFREMMDYKIKDLRAQREYLSEGYLTALETSFGESNTSTALKEKFGILVKRQNGDEIKPNEINQIEEAFTDIQKIFGNLKNIALKKNLKVSHTGKKYAFSGGRALGIYIPSMGTVASTDKYGNDRFKSTMSHELAHFIDNYIGNLNGKRYASDDYEDTAGLLAFTFRNNMNKPKNQQSDYINATQECFARSLQQYFGIESLGDEASYSVSVKELDRTEPMFVNDNFVPKEKYYSEIKPLIEKFFLENEDIFKFTVDIDNTNNVSLPIVNENQDNSNEIEEALGVLELLLPDEIIPDANKKLKALEIKKEKLKERWEIAKEKSTENWGKRDFGFKNAYKMNFSTTKEDELDGRIKQVDKEIQELKSQIEITEAIEVLQLLKN